MPTAEQQAQQKRPGFASRRLVIFGVLEGLALGFPVSWLTHSLNGFVPAPDWLRAFVWVCCFLALLLLPIWSILASRYYHGVLLLGWLTFIFVLLLGLMPVS